MITPLEALERLRNGNRRFVSGTSDRTAPARGRFQKELAAGQKPFAVVLGCSDSRVPPEIVFDQEPGDLFVIRVAGNVIAPPQVGSVEFAVESFDCRLIVVLGHSACGAVMATLEEVQHPSDGGSPNLGSIIDRIRPSVEGLLETELRHDREALVHEAVRANIRASLADLRKGSSVLKRGIEQNELLLVGAEYSLESGVVEFFEGMPESG